MIYIFQREPISGLILVDILIDGMYKLKMMLDTGASFTTFDLNPLYFSKYPVGNVFETEIDETASGKMVVDIFYSV